MRIAKITLEVAKAMYNEGGTGRGFALQHYSKEELTRKELPKSWGELPRISGFHVDLYGDIHYTKHEINVFATKKQAESALAMAMLSQLMKHANGDWEPDWEDSREIKYTVFRAESDVIKGEANRSYEFLAFKDRETRDEFFKNHRRLIDTFLMI